MRTAQDIIKRYDALKSARSNFETHWQDVANYVTPDHDDIQRRSAPGEKKRQRILDNTAVMSNELLAGFLHGVLTNPDDIWLELTTGDEALDSDDDVRLWLQDTAIRMINTMNNSNFQTEVHENYLQLTALGTTPMSIEEDDKVVVRFGTRPIAQCVIDENYMGEVDTLIRQFDWDARQISQKFGEKALSEKMIRDVSKNPNKEYCIIHAIYPRAHEEMNMLSEGNATPGDAKEATTLLPIISKYILKEEKRILKVGGFEEFPYAVSRWSKLPGEKYGRSPGMSALPEAKMINKMAETLIKGAQKVVDPPLQVPHDSFILPINTKPAGLNFYMSGTGSRDEIKPIMNDARIDFGFDVMNSVRQRIREAFYIDQLQLGQGPQMTATEVMQRTEEKTRLLGPLLGRQLYEFLRPTTDRVFGIMLRRKMFQPWPRKLAGKKIDVKYSSMIAKSQRLGQANSMMRAMQTAQPFIALDPQGADVLDVDMAVKKAWKIHGAPQEVIRGQDKLEEIRGARAEAQQRMADQADATSDANVQATQAQAASKLATVK